ncbi:MAG: cytochrome c oxidase subunit 2 [Bacteroidia bacterium]
MSIYNEFNGTAMTAFPTLTDEDINGILMYVENGGWSDGPTTERPGDPPADESLFNKTNWLLLILAFVVFIVVLVIIKTIDLVGKLTGREVIPWNNVNAFLMLLFLIVGMAAGLYELSIHNKYLLLSNASSVHGENLDWMMKITFIITGIVFFITQFCLFYFAFKYRKKPGVKALYYPDNDKLEIIWTIIPAIVLTVLVLGGLNSWQSITKAPEEGTAEIEVFAQQFNWTVRYPGADGVLGDANYNLISELSNPLGVAVEYKVEELLAELYKDTLSYTEAISRLSSDLGSLKAGLGGLTGKELKNQKKQINYIESGEAEADLLLQIRRRKTQIRRIKTAVKAPADKSIFTATGDDDIVGEEIHIVIDQPITLRLRSRDVIHSAYLKEFRAQMNVVPGIPTHFSFTPNKTTAQKREELENNEFDYHIICNKICGNSHYKMKIKVVVEDQKSYDTWMRQQVPTFAKEVAPVARVAPASSDTTVVITPAVAVN